MRPSLTRLSIAKSSAFLLALSLVCAAPHVLARKKSAANDSGPSEQKRAVHALNRLTFGPRPGDVQQVMAMGVDRWIDMQLHPEKISDSAVDARIAQFRTLRMSSRELAEEFPDNQIIKQVMDGKRSMPSDPARRAVFQVQIARLEEKHEKKAQKEAAVALAPAPPSASGAVLTAPASDTAKTAEELAAAAVSGDPAGNPPNNPDSNSTNSMSANSTSMQSMNSQPNQGRSDVAAASGMSMTPRSAPDPAVVDPTAGRRREDRLYADLKIQDLIDLPPDQRYRKV